MQQHRKHEKMPSSNMSVRTYNLQLYYMSKTAKIHTYKHTMFLYDRAVNILLIQLCATCCSSYRIT